MAILTSFTPLLVFIFSVAMCMYGSTDLQCVFNGIWEILQGTDGDGLLWWVLAGAVWLCEEGDHDLDVAFGAQSARLQ